MSDITRVFRALRFPNRRREVVSTVDATPINVQPGEMLYDEVANKLYAGREDTTAVQVGGSASLDVRWDLFLPAAPTGLTATAGNAQASLSWTAPTGVIAQAPITDYREQYSTDNGVTWTTFTQAASTATSATVTGLQNGTAVRFRVAAVNGVGVGAFTAASSSVTPTAGTPPNAPTSLTATAGNAQIALAWTAPSAPGTYAITGYTVEYTPSGGSAQTVSTGSTSTSYTLTGLTNGTAYTVRVAGVSAAGAGSYTAASSAVTPTAGTPPNAPTSLTATAGNAQISLSWTAPSAPGTSAITGYTVEYTPSGGSAQTVSTGGTGTSYTLTGLTNGTAYTVRVAGVSAVGTGAYSGTASGTPQGAYVSVSPATITASVPFSGNQTFTWSGAGTVGNPLTTGGSLGQAELSESQWRVPQFTCGVSGTFYFRAGAREDEGYLYPDFIQYRKNGSTSSSWATSQTNSNGFATRGLTVAAGDIVSLWGMASEYPRVPFSVWIQ
jgi:hypothetical protein